MSSAGGLSRRRGGGGGDGEDSAYTAPVNASSGNSGLNGHPSLPRHINSDSKIAADPRDLQMEDENKTQPKLTLMEEVLLLGLKDKQ
ncbi:hypothetical protein BGZ49_001985, partial [Haplosporangium sp. Z 27]